MRERERERTQRACQIETLFFTDSDAARTKQKEKKNERRNKKNDKFASFAFADKNNGTKDIFISIILIMTPESKQRQDTLPTLRILLPPA